MEKPTDEQVVVWHQRLFRSALRMVASTEDAADLTQEALCRAFRNWHQFDGRSLPTTYLHTILVNCVRDWARRNVVRGRQSPDTWALTFASDGRLGAREQLERKEELAQLRREIDDLSDVVRHTFVAVVIDGYTYQQAAELLAVPVGTIGSRVREARRRLYEAMRQSFPET